MIVGKINKSINASITNKKLNSKCQLLNDWMTPALHHSLRLKQELSLKVHVVNPNSKDLSSCYKRYKNNFTEIIRKAKINYY